MTSLKRIISKNRVKGWKTVSFLTFKSIMVIIKASLGQDPWMKKIGKKDLKGIKKYHSAGTLEIIIDDEDFLEMLP